MKKFISVVAAVFAVSLAGLTFYCLRHSNVFPGFYAGALFGNEQCTAYQTPSDTDMTTQAVTTAVTTTVTTTQPTTVATTTAAPTTVKTTAKPTTTKKTTTTEAFDGETKKVKGDSYTEELKYGVTASVVEYNYYKIMSDGTSVFDKTTKSYTYNRLGYSATIDELKPEAYDNMDKYSSQRSQVNKIVNGYRADKDLSSLTVDDTLTRAANVRALEIAWSDQHDHWRPNGTRWSTLFEAYGITSGKAGENIGWGYDTAAEVCKNWKNSSSHYANIIDGEFKKTGIGVAEGPDGRMYWVQLFSS